LSPTISYNTDASKSWLIVKREHVQQAIEIFQETNVNVTNERRKHLGAAVSSANTKKITLTFLVLALC